LRVQVDHGLKLVPTPYLPPMTGSKKYTLVLDLDETLLHFEELNDTEG
jgi:predicted enzyme involved in methoxymalonyl-ACP biosynthesis